MLPGVNGASGGAIKALATERAILSGIGRGELSAYLNNLRAIASAVAPMLYGNTYSLLRTNGVYPGLAFTVAAIVGGVLPEILHRTMKKEDVVPLSKEMKRRIQRGREIMLEERRLKE